MYEYSYQNGDTFTYYNKEKYISDDKCGIDVSINSDLNTQAIHSVRIWQYPPDVDDGFCLDQIYEDLVMALEDENASGRQSGTDNRDDLRLSGKGVFCG